MAWIGHSALLVFIALSVYFTATKDTPPWSRVRVLQIWVLWSLVYLVMKFAQAALEGRALSSELEWWMPLTGTVIPLWFLPFIYVANSAVYLGLRRLPDKAGWLEAIGWSAATIGAIEITYTGLPIPLAQWSLGVAGVLLAIVIVRSENSPKCWVLLFVSLCVVHAAGASAFAKMFLLALAVTAPVLLLRPKLAIPFAAPLGALSLGVYILHHGVASAIKPVFSDLSPIALAGLVVAISVGIAVLLKSNRRLGQFI